MKRPFGSFCCEESGNVLILTGLAFLFLVGIGGAAYDLGKQQLVRQKLQQAADAGALAGAGREYGISDAGRIDTANTFFALNYPNSYLGIGRPLPSISVAPDVNVSVQATASVPTAFVHMFNVNTLPSKGRSVAQINTPQNKLDVILVMDNSGSMRATDVGAVSVLDGDIPSATAACMVEYWNPVQVAYMNTYYVLLPYYPAPWYLNAYRNACMNPDALTPFVKDYTPPYVFLTGKELHGLVGATRMNALRYAADSMAQSLLNPNPLNHQMAVVKWDNILVGFDGFSNSYASVNASLLSMFAGVDTNSTVGLNKALELSGSFRSDTVRAVVLLTDGANKYTSDNTASVAVCNTLKSQPRTLVFTIVFGTTSANPTVRQFLSDCATGPNGTGDPKPNENLYFFTAENADQLNVAFTSIVGVLKKVRVLQ